MVPIKPQLLIFTLATTLSILLGLTTAFEIGVNYGTLADNLPPPAQVVDFLKTKTTINKVKLFDANPDIIRAFANSGIALSITVPNGEIPNIVQIQGAQAWVNNNVSPFLPQTNIIRVLVGNEILHWGPQNLIDNLVPAMRTLYDALQQAGHTTIQVSTPHSLGILEISQFPSLGKFRAGWDTGVLAPMLQFLKDTNASFIVNPYPYFDTNPATVNFCTFRMNVGRWDKISKILYKNQFDWLMDTTFTAMKALGHGDVEIVAGESGWPSLGDPGPTWIDVETAKTFNSRLIAHVSSGVGTPLMPGKKFETYIFGLFNENLKPGPLAERNFGLFRPDLTPVYDAGIMKGPGGPALAQPQPTQPGPLPVQPRPMGQPGKQWCVPKPEATDPQLQASIDYVCGQGVDCKPIQAGGACFVPGNLRAIATYAMNAFYQTKGHQPPQCDFSGTGIITNVNPSNGACIM